MLLFGAEAFVFQVAIQKFKDQDILDEWEELLNLNPREAGNLFNIAFKIRLNIKEYSAYRVTGRSKV